MLSFAPQSVALDGLEDGRGTASLPSRSIHATSSDDWQLRPVRRIAGIQHWFGPPGRAEQPCPPHKTQSPWQQTRPEGCRTPAWQPNAAGVRDKTPSACPSGDICVRAGDGDTRNLRSRSRRCSLRDLGEVFLRANVWETMHRATAPRISSSLAYGAIAASLTDPNRPANWVRFLAPRSWACGYRLHSKCSKCVR